jgi:hypothetical protein
MKPGPWYLVRAPRIPAMLVSVNGLAVEEPPVQVQLASS